LKERLVRIERLPLVCFIKVTGSVLQTQGQCPPDWHTIRKSDGWLSAGSGVYPVAVICFRVTKLYTYTDKTKGYASTNM